MPTRSQLQGLLATSSVGWPDSRDPLPDCCRQLSGHGWYERYFDSRLVPIRRLRCSRCGVSHALLPEDLCAYQDLTLTALEQAKPRDGPTDAARAAGCEGEVRRARRWLRGRLWRQLRALLDGADGAWQRAVALVGPEPGVLVRLRHKLWRRFGLWLGGPCGLFRRGRPPALGHPASP